MIDFPKLADRVSAGEIKALSIERAARYIEKQRDDYVQEFGMYDPSTGVTEFSTAGEERLSTLEELIDGIRSLHETPKPPGNQIRTAECDGKDAVPVTGQLPVGTASPRQLLTETSRYTMRTVSDAEIERWAATRADDAGFLARKLILERCGRWLPIATAPKDGTRIWIYYPTTSHKTGKPGLGTKTEDAISLVGYWREAPSHEGGGYWTTDYKGKEKRKARATHWQQLPAPPAIDAACEYAPSPQPNVIVPSIDRDRAAKAAAEANAAYGQWMPERWLHLFLDAYEGKSR